MQQVVPRSIPALDVSLVWVCCFALPYTNNVNLCKADVSIRLHMLVTTM